MARSHTAEVSLVEATLKVGAASAGIGFLAGGTAGILKSTTPIIYGISSSLQCAFLGSAFWALRSTALQSRYVVQGRAGDLTKASAAAGAVSGGLSGLIFRGPRVIIPRTIAMAGVSAVGQMLVNIWSRQPASVSNGTAFWTKISNNAWSPITAVSNDEYAAMLRERLLGIETEIAMIDDKLAALKKEAIASTVSTASAASAASAASTVSTVSTASTASTISTISTAPTAPTASTASTAPTSSIAKQDDS